VFGAEDKNVEDEQSCWISVQIEFQLQLVPYLLGLKGKMIGFSLRLCVCVCVCMYTVSTVEEVLVNFGKGNFSLCSL
jgi:hypothetical protein